MRKIIIAISFMVIAASTFAGNPEKNLTPEKKLDAAIQNQVAFPNFLQEEPGVYTAEVHFMVNANGTITVKDIVTDNANLRSNLTRQIGGLQVSTAGLDLNETYKITFRFKTISDDSN